MHPLREDHVHATMRFFSHPQMRQQDDTTKLQFLLQRSIMKEEIEEAKKRLNNGLTAPEVPTTHSSPSVTSPTAAAVNPGRDAPIVAAMITATVQPALREGRGWLWMLSGLIAGIGFAHLAAYALVLILRQEMRLLRTHFFTASNKMREEARKDASITYSKGRSELIAVLKQHSADRHEASAVFQKALNDQSEEYEEDMLTIHAALKELGMSRPHSREVDHVASLSLEER